MNKFTNTVSGKVALSGFLILVLLIPLLMVENLISERERRSFEVQQEIASKWGKEQNISGPLLQFNVSHYIGKDKKGNKHYKTQSYVLLPEDLEVEADVKTIQKKRGIYTAILYRSKVLYKGYFSRKRLKEIIGPNRYSNSYLSLTASDTRDFDFEPDSSFNNHKLEFVPGSRFAEFGIGVNSMVKLDGVQEQIPFEIEVTFAGSSSLFFNPTAKRTMVQIKSDWVSPKFDGAYLPQQSTITRDGFTAKYQVSWLGRSYDQVLNKEEIASMFDGNSGGVTYDGQASLGRSSFGVSFILTADHYQKTERSVKYGVLFLVLTFGAFFLSEILFKLRMHPVQYLMIGSILVIFYLLLISLSEHIAFGLSYAIAVVASSLVIAAYSYSILKKGIHSFIPSAVLFVLYGFLYILLQSEDHALLVGSLLLFSIVSLAMYLTRKIDWYEIDFIDKK